MAIHYLKGFLQLASHGVFLFYHSLLSFDWFVLNSEWVFIIILSFIHAIF